MLRHLQLQPKAQPPPFFYARVQARLGRQVAATAGLPAWLRRPLYAALLGALVLTVSGDGSGVPASAGRPSPYSGQQLPQ